MNDYTSALRGGWRFIRSHTDTTTGIEKENNSPERTESKNELACGLE